MFAGGRHTTFIMSRAKELREKLAHFSSHFSHSGMLRTFLRATDDGFAGRRTLSMQLTSRAGVRMAAGAVAFQALLAVGAVTAGAQSTEGIGPIVLRLPSSARIAAMANAGLASNDGDAMLYNPALLSTARGTAVSLESYGSNATAGALGMVQNAGPVNIGIGVQFLQWSSQAGSYAEAVRYGASHLADRGSVAAASTAITFGVSRTVFGRSVGVSAKYVEDRFAGAHDGTMAFDAGVMLPSPGPGNLAFVVQNVGEGLRLQGEQGRLPTSVGLGYGGGMYSRFESFDFGFQTALTVERGGFVRPAGGAELGYVPIEGVALVVRGGVKLPRERDEPLATGGLGITVDRVSLDYAIEPFRGGRPVSHRLGLRIK
jgi:hypothetical protein